MSMGRDEIIDREESSKGVSTLYPYKPIKAPFQSLSMLLGDEIRYNQRSSGFS
jgi:hypothetical protein